MKVYEYQRNYDLENDYWWFVGVRKMVHMLLNKELKGQINRCLDLGCGTGALLDELKPRVNELWGADISPEALAFCAERGHEKNRLVQCSADNLPFEDNYFDVVTAIGLIEHIQNDEKFIREVYRVLRPNGVLIMLTSSFQFLWSEHDDANEHVRRYYLKDIERKFEKNHFERLKLSHLNFILFPLIALMLKLNDFLKNKNSKPERIMPKISVPVNFVLTQILSFECFLMSFMRLPWGISMIGSFKKK